MSCKYLCACVWYLWVINTCVLVSTCLTWTCYIYLWVINTYEYLWVPVCTCEYLWVPVWHRPVTSTCKQTGTWPVSPGHLVANTCTDPGMGFSFEYTHRYRSRSPTGALVLSLSMLRYTWALNPRARCVMCGCWTLEHAALRAGVEPSSAPRYTWWVLNPRMCGCWTLDCVVVEPSTRVWCQPLL